jgi:hypothetical protein
MRFTVATLLIGLACALPASAQSPFVSRDQAVSPLNVTTEFSSSVGAECDGGEGLVVQLQYTGAQPLRGYLVALYPRDSVTGRKLPLRAIQGFTSPLESMIATGTTWTRTVCAIPESVAGVSVTVTAKIDVLKFADGTIWGPAALSATHQLLGQFEGMDFVMGSSPEEKFVAPILPAGDPVPVQSPKSQTTGPVSIESGIWRDPANTDMLVLEITNASATPIRGYVFTISFIDPATGNYIRRVTTKEVETHGDPSDYLAPAGTWLASPRKFSHLDDGSLADYKIDLDYVVFADGSTFGPHKSRESDELQGMILGIEMAKVLGGRTSVNLDR